MEIKFNKRIEAVSKFISDNFAVSPEATMLVVGDYNLIEQFNSSIYIGKINQIPDETFIKENTRKVDIIYVDSTKLELKQNAYYVLFKLLKDDGLLIVHYYDDAGLVEFLSDIPMIPPFSLLGYNTLAMFRKESHESIN